MFGFAFGLVIGSLYSYSGLWYPLAFAAILSGFAYEQNKLAQICSVLLFGLLLILVAGLTSATWVFALYAGHYLAWATAIVVLLLLACTTIFVERHLREDEVPFLFTHMAWRDHKIFCRS